MATYPILDHSSDDLFSGYVPAGDRSYFFDVRRTSSVQLQLEMSELVCRDKVWTKQKLVIPAENLREVYMGMCEAIKALRKAAQEFGVPMEPPANTPIIEKSSAPAVKPKEQPVKRHRGTGREASTAR